MHLLGWFTKSTFNYYQKKEVFSWSVYIKPVGVAFYNLIDTLCDSDKILLICVISGKMIATENPVNKKKNYMPYNSHDDACINNPNRDSVHKCFLAGK